MLVSCPVCKVPQTIVTGTGLLRTHDRIDLTTGAVLGRCPASGEGPPDPDALPAPAARSEGRRARHKSLGGKRSAYNCRVCGAFTWICADTNRLADHAFPGSDALCRASDMTKRWLPRTVAEGRPVASFSTGQPLREGEQKRWRPLTNLMREKQKRLLAADRRKKAAQGRAAERAEAVPMQVVAGGAPGLGKRR